MLQIKYVLKFDLCYVSYNLYFSSDSPTIYNSSASTACSWIIEYTFFLEVKKTRYLKIWPSSTWAMVSWTNLCWGRGLTACSCLTTESLIDLILLDRVLQGRCFNSLILADLNVWRFGSSNFDALWFKGFRGLILNAGDLNVRIFEYLMVWRLEDSDIWRFEYLDVAHFESRAWKLVLELWMLQYSNVWRFESLKIRMYDDLMLWMQRGLLVSCFVPSSSIMLSFNNLLPSNEWECLYI